jgi:hypothetical protein
MKGGSQNITRLRKTMEICHHQIYPKEWLKEVLKIERKQEGKLGPSGRTKHRKSTYGYTSFEFFK